MSHSGYTNTDLTKPNNKNSNKLSGHFGTVTKLKNGSYKKKYRKKERMKISLERSIQALDIMYNGKPPYRIIENVDNNSAVRMPYLGIDLIKIIGEYKDYKERSDIFLKSITVEKLVDESIRLFEQLKRLQTAQLIHGDIRPVNILMNELAFSSNADLFNIIDFDLLDTVSTYKKLLDDENKIKSTLYPYGLMHFFKNIKNNSNELFLTNLMKYLNLSELTDNFFFEKILSLFALADINQLTNINESDKESLLKYIDTFSLSISLLMLIYYIYKNRDSNVEDEIGRRDAFNQIKNSNELLKTHVNDTIQQKNRDDYLNTIVDHSQSFTNKNARHSLTQLLSNIVFSIHMSEIHENNLDNILRKLDTIKGTLQSENAEQKSDLSEPKNAYWIGGHSSELLSSFTVPPGCTIVLKTQIGISITLRQSMKYYNRIIDVKSDPYYYNVFTHPDKKPKEIFKLFDNIAIYKAGQRCPDMIIYFASTYSNESNESDKSNESYSGAYGDDSGVINFHNITKHSNLIDYSSFTFDDIKNKYAIVQLIKKLFDTSEYPNLNSMTFIEIIKYLFDSCKLIIIDHKDELKNYIEDTLQEYYNIIITSEIINNPISITKVIYNLGVYLSHIKCTLSYLCNIRPGTYYHFLCRDIVGVEQNQFHLQEMLYNNRIPTYIDSGFFKNKNSFRKNMIPIKTNTKGSPNNTNTKRSPIKTHNISKKIYNKRQKEFTPTRQHQILAQEKRIFESIAHRKPLIRNVFENASNETRRNNALLRAQKASNQTQKKLKKLQNANNNALLLTQQASNQTQKN